jgi:hypothetical protein
MGNWAVCKGGQRTAAGEVLRTSKEVARQRRLEGLARGLVVQDASAHCVEDVKVAGLRTSGCGGQVGGLGHGLGASLRASDAARASCTQYLQRPRGGGERPVGARCVAVWISARESTIAPDGLELIGKVLATGVGRVEVALDHHRQTTVQAQRIAHGQLVHVWARAGELKTGLEGSSTDRRTTRSRWRL